jgi:cell division GTPase FtsZ
MHPLVRPLLIPALLAIGALPVIARAPTPEEQGRIEAALRGAGYIAWGNIEIRNEGDRILVEQARKTESGPPYSVVVEPTTMRVAEEMENAEEMKK